MSDVGVRVAPRPAVEELEAQTDDAGAEDVGESKAFADEEAFAVQVLLDDGDGHFGHLGKRINRLLVVGADAGQRKESLDERVNDLRVEERHPFKNVRVVLLIFSEESGFLVLGRNYR